MSDVFLSYARVDVALAEALAAALRARRLSVWSDRSIMSGSDFTSSIEAEMQDARVVVGVWSEAARSSAWVRRETESARHDGKLVVVVIDDTPLPPEWSQFQVLDLRGWRGEASDPRLEALLAVVSPAAAYAPAVADARVGTVSRRLGFGGAIVEGVGAIVGGLVGWLKRGRTPELPATQGVPPAPPVLLAATAPRRCVAGTPFTAALAAYVDSARATALQHLADLGEHDDRRIADVAVSAWLVGAPVTVRLAADGATVTPAEIRFAWNGHENLAAFVVTVADAAPRDVVVLSFAVFVADVAVAHLPMRVAFGSAADATPARTQAAVPGSAFASYSSGDAELVAQRLSTLSRWSPGLDIFQDCLDLRPGEKFKLQIASQIAAREVFLLFWSRRAAASPWVRWEYTTALDRKGVDAILPMPIEDPAIAPPPPELAESHLRDRFLLAGYALAKVHEEVLRGAS